MDDSKVYGDRCHYLSFKKALEYKPPILTDYEIRAIYTPKKEILDLIRKNILIRPKTGKWNSVIEARTLSSLLILNKTLKDIKFKHCISYHNSIDRADAFADSQDKFTKFLKFKTIKTFHISSRISVSARERLIKTFENITPSLVTNARCLSEGVDIPKVDSILFCDPRESRIDVVQAMGRALRVAKNKKKSYIMIPAMVNEEGVIDDKDFQTILNAVSAIGSSDNQLIDWFESVCKGRKSGPGKVKFIVPKGTKVDYQKITEALQIKIYDRLKRITKKDFNKEYIIECALAYFDKKKVWPSQKSGKLSEDTDDTWGHVNHALVRGNRGFPGGSTIPEFLRENKVIIKTKNLSEKQIIRWVKEYQEANEGKLPQSNSGTVQGTHETWKAISHSLGQGLRGLTKWKGSSLNKFLIEKGFKEKKENLTLEKIKEAGEKFFKKHNRYPNVKSGSVQGTDANWWNADLYLKSGKRGLKGGSSLKKLFDCNNRGLPNISEEIILNKIDEYYEENDNKHPNIGSEGEPVKGCSWIIIDKFLRKGHRGLPKVKGLRGFLEKHGRKYQRRSHKKKLLTKDILSWAKKHQKENGEWPNSLSGGISGTDITWRRIDTCLRQGYRGFPGGSSLEGLLINEGLATAKEDLSEKIIIKLVKSYKKKHKKWPTCDSGKVDEVDEN